MSGSTRLRELARWVADARFEDLSAQALEQLKIRILDSLGCALGAIGAGPVRQLREHVEDFGGAPRCTLIGGDRTSPDRAAFYNAALVRYLDFNDSYLAPDETCHPSDNLGALLAAAEDAAVDGRELLTAMGIAYQVQCRLSDEAPVRDHGFDHTVQGQYSVAAGVARLLELEPEGVANAIAISGTAHNALRVTRTGEISNWKGLAFSETCFTGTHSAYLARRGITGPPALIEGNKGFEHTIAGEFEIDWTAEDLERVTRTIIKRHNAEIHSQTTLEAALALRAEHEIDPERIEAIEIDTFGVAFRIIGGGEEGDKTVVENKEQADHSLHYMVAAALLDGQVMPEQYEPERIEADDVQRLLRKVEVSEREELSRRFPEEMPIELRILMQDGTTHTRQVTEYEGFHSRPMGWEAAREKFDHLAEGRTDQDVRDRIVAVVESLEERPVAALTHALAEADRETRRMEEKQ